MKILFITYVNRSGSTFLSNLLSSSDDICVCPESDILVNLFLEDPNKEIVIEKDKLLKSLSRDKKITAWEFDTDIEAYVSETRTNFQIFTAIIRYYRDRMKPLANVIVFKAERMSFLMSEFSNHLIENSDTEIQFISLIRDPRAVISSQLNTIHPGINQPMTNNVVWSAVYWKRSVRWINRFNSNDLPLMIIKYEDLINKHKKCILELSGFIGLTLNSLSPAEGVLLKALPAEIKTMHSLANQDPDPRRIDGWRSVMSEKNKYLVERTCRFDMDVYDYKRDTAGIQWLTEWKRFYGIFTYNLRIFCRKVRYHLSGFLK